MLVRFGFVAMSVLQEKASPSKAVTFKNYQQLARQNPGAALDKVKRVARENLFNTLRLLRHCQVNGVKLYRFSSKIIPLATHPELTDWDYLTELSPQLQQIGEFVKQHEMRVTFHPDHFTLINTPREDVFQASVNDLMHHCRLLEVMRLNDQAKLITHIGGGYGNKKSALDKFIENWARIPQNIARRIALENDDKTFTARDTLCLCQKLQLPMVLDIHHFSCNHETDSRLEDIYPGFVDTWQETGLPPKIHASSPKSEADSRGHHDYVEPGSVYNFIKLARELPIDLDVMVEAKQKDQAMFKLVQDLSQLPGIVPVSAASVRI
ncbi:UV DNA damage endonuclease [Sporotomaculum syntrophicum]|uniref:UV DNA damage endonuclease n=1 Tax=Sporotomaculum syntrophicum TaxID=182264 RepID=A0A9D2WQW0_9FIRM|nr:UV DNA damage repair endonuclease UvsE [Sporotomaculum syntrophicum]KAF1085703.1 UV DNA damage endonuclease [Sporotomaculum syntrophicum]